MKLNTILELLCLLLILNSRILGLIWQGRAYFIVNDWVNYFNSCLVSSNSDQRASCRTRVTYFWLRIKRLKTPNVQIFPFVNLICLCWIINHFSWIMNAFCSEKPDVHTKHGPGSMDFPMDLVHGPPHGPPLIFKRKSPLLIWKRVCLVIAGCFELKALEQVMLPGNLPPPRSCFI